MMKKLTLFIAGLFRIHSLYAIEKMDDNLLVHYGNVNAPLKVIEYMSFSCPHCVKIFHDFPKIKKDYIDTGILCFTFQPVPKDLTTLRALCCLEVLTEREKQIFLEGLFEYLDNNKENADELCKVMQDFMTCFGKKDLQIDDMAYLKQSPVMEKAFIFLTQEEQVKALPTAEINGFLFASELPNHTFFKVAVKAVLGEE